MSLLVAVPVIGPPDPDVVASWTHRPHVVLVNGNHDRWHSVAQEHGLLAIRHKGNYGVARSWNEGFEIAAKANITHVALMSQHLRLHKGTGQLAGAVDTFADERGLLTWFAFHCVVFSTALWLRVGRFDEAFFPAYYEDSDYVRRLFLSGDHTPERPMVKLPRAILDGDEQTAMTLKAGLIDPACYGRNAQRFRDKWGGDPDHERWTLPWNPDTAIAAPTNWTSERKP